MYVTAMSFFIYWFFCVWALIYLSFLIVDIPMERPDTKKSFRLLLPPSPLPASLPAFLRPLRQFRGIAEVSVGVCLGGVYIVPGCSPLKGELIFLCLDGDFFVIFALTSFLFCFLLLVVLLVFKRCSTLTRCYMAFLCCSGCFRWFVCFSSIWGPCAYMLKYHHEVRKKADPSGSGPIILLLALRFFLPTSWCPGKAGCGEKIVKHISGWALLKLFCSHDLCVVLLESSKRCVDFGPHFWVKRGSSWEFI